MDYKMNQALQALRGVDFNWTHDLQGVWYDPFFQVDELHKMTIDRIMDDFLLHTTNPTSNPIGRVVLGEAGAGKTHLIGTLRRRVWQAHGWFVLLDIIGITDFWATTALGFVNSLHQPMTSGQTQYQAVLSAIVNKVPLDSTAQKAIVEWKAKPDRTRLDTVDLFLKLLRRIDHLGTTKHQDVIRALLLLDSDDWDASNLAYCWLQGLDVDESKRRDLKFLTAPPLHSELVRGMLWVMSLAGPTLIAVDQIDPIINASNILADVDGAAGSESEKKARHIIQTMAGGLMELHDLKKRAMTVVSCLQVTWPIIKERDIESAAHRFEELPVLEPIKSRDIVENLIAGRLNRAYEEVGFRPLHRTWPFRPEAIDSAVGLLPRQILIHCQEHRQQCIAAGEVLECASLGQAITAAPRSAPTPGLDQEFQSQMACADISSLLDKENEDTTTRDLSIQIFELFLKQLNLPDTIDAIVKPDPDRKKPSLHARLSFIFHDKGDQEQQYCFRILGHTNAIAFQSRLKAAMTASGIDTALRFRHLFILRRGDPPGGPKTKALVDQFFKAGGKVIAPTDDDLRAFVALRAMFQRDLPGFDTWLRARKPLFDVQLFKAAGLCPPPFLLSAPSPKPGEGPSAPKLEFGQKTATHITEQIPAPAAPRLIPIGRRFDRDDLVTLTADLLPRHVAILAGSGSGKTVLLRRLVEEAALIGIPSIVLDINNDLSRLGDPWPTRPVGFSDEDLAKASTYHRAADVVIWTPGRSSGNPISLKLLPAFSATDEDPDERDQAVEMARATLTPFISAKGASASLKHGVLSAALRRFAQKKGLTLDDLIHLLAALPEDVSQISKASKLGADMADQLHAAIDTNPLLKSAGSTLDPKTLFYAHNGKTRLSVINLSGLGSDEARQAFVNQLQMTLFTWIKQNPSPTCRLYVLDESQNFAPSQAGTACKQSTSSLAAQARKYGLGMIFATQLPKGIDNKIVSNCTTHFYGRMSSPVTIEAIRELMTAKGGAADDIGRLTKGEFYFSTDGLSRPVKIRTPLCLSWHAPNPPSPDEVIERARRSSA